MEIQPLRGWGLVVPLPWVFTHGYSDLVPSEHKFIHRPKPEGYINIIVKS